MESIKKYVENLKKSRKLNVHYSMCGEELFLAAEEVRRDSFCDSIDINSDNTR